MPAPPPRLLPPKRLVSLDVYRGLAMFLMGLELLELDKVAAHFPGNAFWDFVGFHAAHVPWAGCSLHDLIHPSFCFMVGAALPFSVASRLARGQSKSQLARHAGLRAVILIFLGIFIRSLGRSDTNWTFEDTLTQIGLGYPFVFALAFAGTRARWATIAVILAGYWFFFACHPLLPVSLDDDAINIPAGWNHHYNGFFAHWNLNRNAAWSFDVWLLNLFPRQRPFVGYLGGYNTLNFIPTMATMVLGLIAGTWLKEASVAPAGQVAGGGSGHEPAALLLRRLFFTGLALGALGWGLQRAGICPIVKKIWTPAWVLFSGGWCCWLMAGFYWLIDVRGCRWWTYPFVAIGMNSVAMYVMFHTLDHAIGNALERHLGEAPFLILGPEFHPVLLGSAVLAVLWLILLAMHRRGIHLRI